LIQLRRRWRKVKLLEFMQEFGLTPITKQDIRHWAQKRDQPEMPHAVAWFKLNPYELRAKGLDAELTPHELGRVLYHIVQRRGFLSNRKSDSTEDSTIETGKNDKTSVFSTVGIADTRTAISDFRTLGEFLSHVDPHKERIRNRYTERRMYVDEAKQLLFAQSKYHHFINQTFAETLLGSDSKKNMDSVLFFQRPLRSQKHTLGRCPFEPSKTRCPISALEFEQFRMWQWINSIEHFGEKLSFSEKQRLASYLLQAMSEPKFSAAMKHIGYKTIDDRFNYQADDKARNTPVNAAFRKAFGTSVWETMSPSNQQAFWHDVYTASDDEWLTSRLKSWGLDDKGVQIILKLRMKRDYAALSKKAIRNILPFLELGFPYHEAVLMGGVKKVLGERWETLEDQGSLLDTISGFVGSSEHGTLIDQIKALLKSEFGLSDEQLTKLYHHSQLDHSAELLEKLPEPQSVRNPIVNQAMHEVKSLVNTLIEQYGRFDAIHLELARDLKKSKRERDDIAKDQRKREQENDKILARLREHNLPETYDFKLRLKLFEELREPRCCPYTGKKIHFGSDTGTGDSLGLFSGQVQIEHIIPYSRSLNNSFGNLTLCDADENRRKGNQTPFEYYSSMGVWDQVKERAKSMLPYGKYKHFTKKELDADIASRLLNDTRYMSREVHRYLKMICEHVVVVTGALTADLRHHWGFNSLLSEDDMKDRRDHRHHAVDALVVALTNSSTINRMAQWNKFKKSETERNVSPPWEDVRKQAEFHLNQILVSHKKVTRTITRRMVKTKRKGVVYRNMGLSARGQLHMDTIYGKRVSPETKELAYHVKKRLSSLGDVKQISKVVDPRIRSLLYECLENQGISTSEKGKIPPNTFLYFDEQNKVQTHIQLPDADGRLIPVYTVRMKENLKRAELVKEGKAQYVNPQNNHHVALYRDEDGNLHESCVTFWSVVARQQQGIPAIAPYHENGARLEVSMQINDMFLLGWDGDADRIHEYSGRDLIPYLYRVQKLSTVYYVFRHHLAATLEETEGSFVRVQSLKAYESLNPIKVWMTPDGRIERFKY
jgi:CRISPR-associated endonuclease Csn1